MSDLFAIKRMPHDKFRQLLKMSAAKVQEIKASSIAPRKVLDPGLSLLQTLDDLRLCSEGLSKLMCNRLSATEL